MLGRELIKVEENFCFPFIIYQLLLARPLVSCSFCSNLPRKNLQPLLTRNLFSQWPSTLPSSGDSQFTPILFADSNHSSIYTLLFDLWTSPWQGVQPVYPPRSYLGSWPNLHSDPRNHLPFGGKSAVQDYYLQRLGEEKKKGWEIKKFLAHGILEREVWTQAVKGAELCRSRQDPISSFPGDKHSLSLRQGRVAPGLHCT